MIYSTVLLYINKLPSLLSLFVFLTILGLVIHFPFYFVSLMLAAGLWSMAYKGLFQLFQAIYSNVLVI